MLQHKTASCGLAAAAAGGEMPHPGDIGTPKQAYNVVTCEVGQWAGRVESNGLGCFSSVPSHGRGAQGIEHSSHEGGPRRRQEGGRGGRGGKLEEGRGRLAPTHPDEGQRWGRTLRAFAPDVNACLPKLEGPNPSPPSPAAPCSSGPAPCPARPCRGRRPSRRRRSAREGDGSPPRPF